MVDKSFSIIEMFLSTKRKNTYRSYLTAFEQLIRFVKKDITKINELDVMKYFHSLRQTKLVNGDQISDSTIRLRYYALSSIYEYLQDMYIIKRNPMLGVKHTFNKNIFKQKRPTKWFTPCQVKQLFKLPDSSKKGIRDKAILALLFGAGLRRSELLALNIDSIRIINEFMYVYLGDTKAGEPQTRSLAKFAQKFVSAYVVQRKHDGADLNDPLFVFYYNNGSVRGRMDERTLARRFAWYTKQIGVKAAPHSAKATFATQLKQLGYHDRDVAEALGHTSEHMVRVYDKRNKVFRDDVAGKLKY